MAVSPIAPRRSERLLALRTKNKEISENKAAKEGSSSHQFEGESSKTVVKDRKTEHDTINSATGKIRDKQTSSSKRSTKNSLSESDLAPKQQKRRRVGDKQILSKDKIQRTSSRTATSANQSLSGSKKDKSVSEPLLTSPKGKASSSQDKGKKTSFKESKTLRKGKSSTGASTSGVTTRQLRKLKGRDQPTEMSSDE